MFNILKQVPSQFNNVYMQLENDLDKMKWQLDLICSGWQSFPTWKWLDNFKISLGDTFVFECSLFWH